MNGCKSQHKPEVPGGSLPGHYSLPLKAGNKKKKKKERLIRTSDSSRERERCSCASVF